MSSGPRLMVITSCVALVLAACGEGVTGGGASTSTTAPLPTTTLTDPTTSTSVPVDGLDLSRSSWVTHGPEGIRLDSGDLVWETRPFPAGIARDRQGGLVYTDSAGLWWFPSGASEPTLVTDGVHDLVTVAVTDDGPVAMIWDGGPMFYRLTDGVSVEVPADALVEVSSETLWKWRASNGLAAWVTGPDVELDGEGQPSQILEPAHLIVARGEETLVDLLIGGVYEAWATIHDFDGRTLIVSRGPYEPAMPDETFLVLDLATGTLSGAFTLGGARATLTGADVDWDGPVAVPDLGGLAPSPIASDAGVRNVEDGRYLVFIAGVADDGAELQVDLAVWFSGNEANTAAIIDGVAEVPVPNDYYIRNVDPRIITVPVTSEVEVTSVWYDHDTDPDLESDPIGYDELLDVLRGDDEGVRSNLALSPWWATVEGGLIVALDEQYRP